MLKKFYKWLYLIAMALPIISVLAVVIYTQVNDNAKESYYGEIINDTQLESVNNLNNQKKYQFNSSLVTQYTYYTNADFEIIYKDNLSTDYVPAPNLLSNYLDNNLYLRFRASSNNLMLSFFTDNGYNNVLLNIVFNTNSISFDFILVSYTNTVLSYLDYFNIYTYNKYSYLDNAFYYGLDTTANYIEKGIFRVNNKPVFSGWFSELFTQYFNADMSSISFSNYVLLYLDYALTFNLLFIAFRSLTWLTDVIIKVFDRGNIKNV